jgi:hypothetical protein
MPGPVSDQWGASKPRYRPRAVAALAATLLPLAGAALTHRSLRPIFQFPPPLRIPTDYLHFTWWAAAAVMLIIAAFAFSAVRLFHLPHRPGLNQGVITPPAPARARHYPAWMWTAAIWTLGWWLVAWTRVPLWAGVQGYTFFPLWLGFIVSLNGLAQGRTGTCRLRQAPGRWFGLFGVSAAFWWGFEWLNRFAQNWHYLAVEGIGPMEYAVHASLCFSTVLPAVAAVADVLDTLPGWRHRPQAGPRWRSLEKPGCRAALYGFGCIGLFGTGAAPSWFYPALWLAPLALLLAVAPGRGATGVRRELTHGDWHRAGSWILAAFICGFFWELWNWHSLAKWIYTVPGVDRWHVFEMPLLGYAGYLPFGLECLLVAEQVSPRSSPHL